VIDEILIELDRGFCCTIELVAKVTVHMAYRGKYRLNGARAGKPLSGDEMTAGLFALVLLCFGCEPLAAVGRNRAAKIAASRNRT